MTDELWAAMVNAIYLQTGMPRWDAAKLVNATAWGVA